MKQRWHNWSTKQQTWVVIGAILVVLVIIGSIGGGSDDDTPEPVAASTTPAETSTAPPSQPKEKPAAGKPPKPKPKPAPAPKPPTAREKLGSSLRNNDVKAQVESVEPDVINISAETPEGGFEGPSVDDLNRAAGEIFHSVYGDADYKSRETFITFKGGLISKATGKPNNDTPTGTFKMSVEEASQISWDDKSQTDVIDWDVYGLFAHPALKQD